MLATHINCKEWKQIEKVLISCTKCIIEEVGKQSLSNCSLTYLQTIYACLHICIDTNVHNSLDRAEKVQNAFAISILYVCLSNSHDATSTLRTPR